MQPEIVVEDVAVLRKRLASEVESRAHRAIAGRGRAVIALSGGSTAEIFYPALGKTAVDWSRTDFFWIDERAVPPDDPESNYGAAARLWLTPAGVPFAQIHRMHGEEPDLERAARIAADELIGLAGDPPLIDIALVGTGEDGHVASIFPGAEARSAERENSLTRRLVVPVYNAPKPPSRRLTWTMGVLSSVDRVIVVAVGSSKARAIGEAMKGRKTPLGALLRLARSPLVLVDRHAAAELLR